MARSWSGFLPQNAETKVQWRLLLLPNEELWELIHSLPTREKADPEPPGIDPEAIVAFLPPK
jgi:hypothetical protein